MGCTFSMTCPEKITPQVDGFRGTPLRLLGYATHVGNACSAILPHSVMNVPNIITTTYVMADVFNVALKSSTAGRKRSQVFASTLDALIWHSLATLFLPGLIVSKIKQLTIQASKIPTNKCTPPPPLVKALPPYVLRALPCILGVLSIPLIMYPIDKAVTVLMDHTYKPLFVEPDVEELEKALSKVKKSAQKQVKK